MFTGLVQTVAEIVGRRRAGGGGAGKLILHLQEPWSDPVFGESVAVNGCCLTLERWEAGGVMYFHTLEETLRCTNLGGLPPGARVNVERALRLGEHVGGHLVSGHIDGTGRMLALARHGGDYELKLTFPPELAPELVGKGSISIDGVSLTVVELNDEEGWLTVHLIPVTLAETALSSRKVGDLLNLETDMLGKYVVRQLQFATPGRMSEPNRISMDTLREAGFL